MLAKKKVALAGLQAVPRAEEDNLGVHVSATGTLQIDLDGDQIRVRKSGTGTGSGAEPELEDKEGFADKIRWEDLKMGHVVGEGSQAKVRKVKHRPTGNVYALKVITLGKQVTKRSLKLELQRVLTGVSHPNIVASTEAFYIDGSLKILMEYMDLGTLAAVVQVAGPLPVPILSCVTKQILEGLQSLHETDIVHRDIKPSNLLVNSNGEVKISDFGVSTVLNSVNPFAVTLVGSTAYMSPERVRTDHYDARSDVWSVGLTVAQCALGHFPLYTTEDPGENPFTKRPNMFDLAAMIAEGRAKVDFDILLPKILHFYPDKPIPSVTPELNDFVQQCMKQAPDERPTCKELLQHPLIKNHEGSVDLKEWFLANGITPKRPPDST